MSNTIISLQCIDRTLQPLTLPKLTSGGKDDISVEIGFDSTWDGFAKTVTFYRDKSLVYHATLAFDLCTVPWALVREPGMVYIGVYGVSGDRTRTSEVLALEFEQGAIVGVSSDEAVPDIYQQLLNAYGVVEAAAAEERARLDELVAGSTPSGSEIVDVRTTTDGITHTAAGTAVRDQINRTKARAAHPSVYDLDLVKEHMGLKDLCGVDSLVGQITDATATWKYKSTSIPLPVGEYTVVVRDMALPADGFFAIAASATGQKYLKITEPGIYTMKVYDDEQNYNPAAVVLLLQMAQDAGQPVGVYYASGISVYAGDITGLVAFPEELTGVDQKISIQVGKNLFDKSSPDIVMGRFLSGGGVLMQNEYSDAFYSTGFIPIEAETVYALTDYKIGGAFIVFYDATKTFISGMQGGTELVPAGGIFTTPAGAAYVRLSGNIVNLDTNQLEKGGAITAYEDYVEYALAGENKRRIGIIEQRLASPPVEVVERSTLTTGDSMVAASPHAKNHNIISFSAKVRSFSGITLSHGKTEPYCSAYVTIDATHVHVYAYPGKASKVAAYAHGLKIADFVRVTIQAVDGFTARLKLTTGAGTFAQVIEWNGSKGDVKVESQGSTLTDCMLTYYLEGLQQPVWLFGDSYFDYWPKLLADWGYTDYYLDSYSGRNSAAALESLQKCLTYAAPRQLVWCMGMNDADASAVNYAWNSAYQKVKQLCAQHGVELILATVPNVPGRDHSYKNAIVRSSGYRYVDFCEAVGADKSTAWADGLQSGDGVHPTQQGAAALASRALLDVPELADSRTGVGIKSIEKTSGTGAPGTDEVYTITMTDGSTMDFTVHQGADGAGASASGDMQKKVYDTDNDGVVDNAEKLGGQLPAYYAKADHGHSVGEVEGYDGLIAKTGNPVSQDGLRAGRGVSAVSIFEPVQDGSGDPSPDNIRAIAGLTTASLTGCGKNLIDFAAIIPYGTSMECERPAANSLRVYSSTAATYGAARGAVMLLKAGVTYTLSAKVTAKVGNQARIGFRRARAYPGYAINSFISGSSLTGAEGVANLDVGSYRQSFTLAEDTLAYLALMVTWTTSEIGDATFADVQLEVGNTATAYEAYKGTTLSATLGQTVYGGRLNWQTGELTVDRKLHTFTGTEDIKKLTDTTNQQNSGVFYFSGLTDAAGGHETSICSHFKNAATNVWVNAFDGEVGVYCDHDTTRNIHFKYFRWGAGASTADEFKAFLAAQYAAGTPVQLCYALAEPITTQLTPQEILAAVDGLNTVHGDADELEVTFNHDQLLRVMWSKLIATAATEE